MEESKSNNALKARITFNRLTENDACREAITIFTLESMQRGLTPEDGLDMVEFVLECFTASAEGRCWHTYSLAEANKVNGLEAFQIQLLNEAKNKKSIVTIQIISGESA